MSREPVTGQHDVDPTTAADPGFRFVARHRPTRSRRQSSFSADRTPHTPPGSRSSSTAASCSWRRNKIAEQRVPGEPGERMFVAPSGGYEPSMSDEVAPQPEKDPEDWVTAEEPMTGAQGSYLRT